MALAPVWTEIESRLRNDRAPDLLIRSFARQFAAWQGGESTLLPRGDLADIGPVADWNTLQHHETAGRANLSKAVVINLNGGLGTSMGLDSAKSLIVVKDGLNFLDILARQILHTRSSHQTPLPLLLMNSYRTEADSLAALARHKGLLEDQKPISLSFLQHRVPRLWADTGAPVGDAANEDNWCPPGHGDLYTALATTGLLDQLLAAGRRYAFVSNADNLGATLDVRLLGYLATKKLPFMMEVTRRTAADRKGGHLARSRNGNLVLREVAQCPPEELEDFQDIDRHRFFNTNNLWIDLEALRTYLAKHADGVALPTIVNRKPSDPRDPASRALVQLETAMGSAIGIFTGAEAVEVPRTRFAPVKTTDDLLALRSDAYVMHEDGRIELHAARRGIPPTVKLDPAFYKMLPDFEARFPDGAPSLLKCDSLTVTGDVTFHDAPKFTGVVTVTGP